MGRGSFAASSTWERDLFGKLESFADFWQGFEGTERSGAQEYLQSLLDIYGASFRPGTIFEQHPVLVPERGTRGSQSSLFPSEQAPRLTQRRMDMYLPRLCVWEMKAPSEKHLEKHHEQLLWYWACVRTRYMVLCNFRELWIYDTDEENGQLEPKLKLPLKELPARGDALLFLRGDPPDLAQRSERVTADVARDLGQLARQVVHASPDPRRERERATKFVLECVFAMFAQDTGLVPPRIFTSAMRDAVNSGRMDPVWSLFDDFGQKDPRDKSHPYAPYVSGPLFDRNHPKIALSPAQMQDVYCAAKGFDWQDVRPEIFGSIFEQALCLTERHERGAHFTREADIAKVVGPTVVEPWQQRIEAIRTPRDAERVVEQMRAFHVLDPASGCGNFLYVAYREMKRLEAALVVKWNDVQQKAARRLSDVCPPPPRPYFTIQQLHGIELDGFAAFLTRVVLWIGEHMAKRELGLEEETLPLKNLDANIRNDDALFADWPRPEGELCILGNPPYLGVRKLRRELGDAYVERLFARYPQNRAADYVTYWFTRALGVLRPGERAGFVCTNSVAQNESREASIDRILAQGGAITDAHKSYPWPGEAAVHVGIVNWVMAPYDGVKTLDGKEVARISPALTQDVDLTGARRIPQNEALCFMGATPGNRRFVLTADEQREIVEADPGSAAVIKPFLVGRDVAREVEQRPTRWIIDFGTMKKEEAEQFAGAMHHVRKHVYPQQAKNGRESRARSWWRFAEPAPHLRRALRDVTEVLVMPSVAPHLVVSRQKSDVCFDHQLMVVARGDSFALGVLQSRIHATWAWARGSTLKSDLRYTNTTIFETFPFPLHPDGRYDPRRPPDTDEARRVAIAAQAFETVRSTTCREQGAGLTKVHKLLAAGKLPELARAYEALNDAVTACYGFPDGTWRDDQETRCRLLDLNERIAGPARGLG